MVYNLKIPCSKDSLSEIRTFLSDVLTRHSVPEVQQNTLILAVDEVCANLIIHSHHCNPDETIKLKVDVDDGSDITFEISDNGIGFDISEYKEPNISDIVRQKRKGGIGLMLVRRIMDEIELIEGKKSNVYRLYKKF